MTLKFSSLVIGLGLGLALIQIVGLLRPGKYAAALRRFSRNTPAGVALMLLGTAWFVWNLSQESISDFASYKDYLLAGFAAVGLGSCVFVQDFLAVRGLAVVFLLLAKLMVDSGRPFLPATPWVLVIQAWAYVLVVAGIWLTVSPWRMRDFLNWSAASESRLRFGLILRLIFGLFVAALGFTKF
jgi:hypothetical protein